MKTSDFKELIELKYVGNGFIPANRKSLELCEQLKHNEEVMFRNVSGRDLGFHRCYFSLMGFIYDYLPSSFRNKINRGGFYTFLKHISGEYEVIHTFKDGTQQIEYNSISFGRMNQNTFKEYVQNQLTFIYSDVLEAYFADEQLKSIIETIEIEYEKFLSKFL